MGCDMLVARGLATVAGQSLFGLNLFHTSGQRLELRHIPASYHSPDETVPTRQGKLPQVRETCAVLGAHTDVGWGLTFGVSERRVAVGVARWRSRFDAAPAGLTGAELTRLALERSHSAQHAAEVLIGLIAHHGQHEPESSAPNAVFVIADPQEACVLEVAGKCWAFQEAPETRAVSDAALIRQDWRRLSPGLADQAIQSGWWRDDGSKLDFVGSLGSPDPVQTWGLKRWSKATLALTQGQEPLDVYEMRSLLADHFESCVRGNRLAPKNTRRLCSVVARLDAPGGPLVWLAAGATRTPLYFPLSLAAELPDAWTEQPPVEDVSRECIARLQAQFDQDAEDFLAEANNLATRGEKIALRRLAQALMQKHLEQWDVDSRRRSAPAAPAAARADRDSEDELVPFFG
jgi:hypothetical protein